MTTKLNLSRDSAIEFTFDGGSLIGYIVASGWDERGASGLIRFSFLTSHELREGFELATRTDGIPFGIKVDSTVASGDHYQVFCRVPCSFVDLTTLTTVD